MMTNDRHTRLATAFSAVAASPRDLSASEDLFRVLNEDFSNIPDFITKSDEATQVAKLVFGPDAATAQDDKYYDLIVVIRTIRSLLLDHHANFPHDKDSDQWQRFTAIFMPKVHKIMEASLDVVAGIKS